MRRLIDSAYKIRKIPVPSFGQAVPYRLPIRRARSQPSVVLSLTKKITALLLIICLNVNLLIIVKKTLAFYSDTETSVQNSFTAGILDFALAVTPWQPEATAAAMKPDDSVSRAIDIIDYSSLPFQYLASTTFTGADFDLCQALELKAKLDGTEVYNGPLMNFATSSIIFSAATDEWDFTVSLPFNAPETLQNKTCNFDFFFGAWQISFPVANGGFVDEETLANSLRSGTWMVAGSTNIGPIDDSYVNEKQENQNYGTSQELVVKSKDLNENKRTFIKFDFHFPAGIIINSANLAMYLKDPPPSQRFYEARQILETWEEETVTWSNQPNASTTASDTQIAETTPQWLNWIVTQDVKEIVNGSISNYGWRINDSSENSATAREGKFASQENNDENKRPYLEVAFSALSATTTHLVINEVYYDVAGTKGSNTHNEWVEIYNPTNAAVDISGWQICDNASCDAIPLATPAIPAKGFALIANDASTWNTYWTVPAATIKIALGSEIGNGLANDGDRLMLKDTGFSTIDAMSYGNDITFFSLPISEQGDSLARIIKGYDSDLADDWIINATPNPGSNPAGEEGVEFIRFTARGALVAASQEELRQAAAEEQGKEESPKPATEQLVAVDNLKTTAEELISETAEELRAEQVLVSEIPAIGELAQSEQEQEVPEVPQEVPQAESVLLTEQPPASLPQEIIIPENNILKKEKTSGNEPDDDKLPQESNPENQENELNETISIDSLAL